MGARRPRTQPNPKTVSLNEEMKKAHPDVPVPSINYPIPGATSFNKDGVNENLVLSQNLASDGIPYASLRLKSTAGKLRYSNNSLLIEANDDQTITLYADKVAPSGKVIPFPHFKVMPSGVEVMIENVTGAIPSNASITEKLSMRSRTAARAERLKTRMRELAEENAEIAKKVSLQDVPEEDDDVDESIDDEDDVEGDLGGDDEEDGDGEE